MVHVLEIVVHITIVYMSYIHTCFNGTCTRDSSTQYYSVHVYIYIYIHIIINRINLSSFILLWVDYIVYQDQC